jgi:glycosyltransferase involved in cell wall biosynthesis
MMHNPLRNYGSRVDGAYKLWPPGKTMWGEDMIQRYVKEEIKPDLLAVLLDSFMLHYMIDLRKYPRGMDLSPAKKLFYFPSDGEPLPNGTPELFKRFEYLVAMAKWGQEQAVQAGFPNCEYIPHAIDEQDFYELPDVQKQVWRKRWNIPDNTFVALSVFRNQGRKMPAEMLKAWAKFAKDKNDVLLVLHADPFDPAAPINTNELIARYGIQNSVKWTGMQWNRGFSVKEIRGLYNLADIHTLSTSGEGFGIPIIESMVCGTPNVLPDFTTPRELVGDAGYLARMASTITGQYNVERGIVNTDSLAQGYQTYYDNRDLLKEHAIKGVKKVKKEYTWRKTYPEWQKLFRRIRNDE